MGILDLASGATEAFDFADNIGEWLGEIDIVSDSLGDITEFVTDVAGGAIVNGAVTALQGGDIGQSMLFGAVGNAFSDDMFGGFGNELGGAISGYGLAESVGGDGLLGAASGAAGAYLSDRNSSTAKAEPDKAEPEGDAGLEGAAPKDTGAFSISQKMQEYGLQNKEGEGTLLGKTVVGGVAGLAQQDLAEKAQERQAELLMKRDENTKRLDTEREQERIAAFAAPKFRVQRNG